MTRRLIKFSVSVSGSVFQVDSCIRIFNRSMDESGLNEDEEDVQGMENMKRKTKCRDL